MFIISPMIPLPVEVSVLKKFDQMSVAINPCLISFALSIMVVCFCSELICPLVKQTKQYPKDYANNNAGDDLPQSQIF